ncbi:hypothetical protein EV127DRAFT_487915 [Xylaria flabelliformis]|nr:hypothetical protein EV127DRAFT_487915 [Xylaria flabelliformis]
MQRIAKAILPGLIPRLIQAGTATNSEGETFYFSVTEFVDAIAIAEAARKLHRSRLWVSEANETRAKDPSSSTDFDIDRCLFGGPHTGFLADGSALLDAIIQIWILGEDFSTKHHVLEYQGIKIQSNFEDLGSVVIKTSEIEQWPSEAVSCHNDLIPRNIIIKSHTSLDGSSHYKLAGIIDWELVGSYPPSYELSLQNVYLSAEN